MYAQLHCLLKHTLKGSGYFFHWLGSHFVLKLGEECVLWQN